MAGRDWVWWLIPACLLPHADIHQPDATSVINYLQTCASASDKCGPLIRRRVKAVFQGRSVAPFAIINAASSHKQMSWEACPVCFCDPHVAGLMSCGNCLPFLRSVWVISWGQSQLLVIKGFLVLEPLNEVHKVTSCFILMWSQTETYDHPTKIWCGIQIQFSLLSFRVKNWLIITTGTPNNWFGVDVSLAESILLASDQKQTKNNNLFMLCIIFYSICPTTSFCPGSVQLEPLRHRDWGKTITLERLAGSSSHRWLILLLARQQGSLHPTLTAPIQNKCNV